MMILKSFELIMQPTQRVEWTGVRRLLDCHAVLRNGLWYVHVNALVDDDPQFDVTSVHTILMVRAGDAVPTTCVDLIGHVRGAGDGVVHVFEQR